MSDLLGFVLPSLSSSVHILPPGPLQLTTGLQPLISPGELLFLLSLFRKNRHEVFKLWDTVLSLCGRYTAFYVAAFHPDRSCSSNQVFCTTYVYVPYFLQLISNSKLWHALTTSTHLTTIVLSTMHITRTVTLSPKPLPVGYSVLWSDATNRTTASDNDMSIKIPGGGNLVGILARGTKGRISKVWRSWRGRGEGYGTGTLPSPPRDGLGQA